MLTNLGHGEQANHKNRNIGSVLAAAAHQLHIDGALETANVYIHKIQEAGHIGKVKLQAFIGHIKSAPSHLIDNEYIQHGYRINFNSFGKICRSLFMLHNETINVWSHLIGVMLFIGLLVWTQVTLSPITGYLNSAA